MTTATEQDSASPAPQSPSSRKMREVLSQNGPLLAAVSVALVFCIIIGSLFWPFLFGTKEGTTLLRELSNFEVARGLITFLVAVTTVGIALILTVYVVVTQDQGAEKKFSLGKEVLTGLIGVLGTIVGFYFGSGTTQSPGQSAPATTMSIKELRVEPKDVKPGNSFKVFVSTTGIKAPFDYAISFKPENVVSNKSDTSEMPDFSVDFAVPAGAAAGALELALQLKDRKSAAPLEVTGPKGATVKITP